MKPYQRISRMFALLLAAVLLLSACGETVQPPDPDPGETSQKQETPGNDEPSNDDPSSEITEGVMAENKETGCALSVYDGVYALELPEGTVVEENPDRMAQSSFRSTALVFSTPEEFRETMQTLNFTEEQMAIMRKSFIKTEDGKVKLFDVAHLYQPNFSEEFDISGIVVTSGTYSYGIVSEHVTVRLDVEVKDDFDRRFFVGYTNIVAQNPQWGSVQQEEGEQNGVPATIYSISPEGARWRIVLYELPVENGTAYVIESYLLQSSYTPEVVSESVPTGTQIFVETEDVRYICDVKSDHALTAEEILSMKMTEILG